MSGLGRSLGFSLCLRSWCDPRR